MIESVLYMRLSSAHIIMVAVKTRSVLFQYLKTNELSVFRYNLDAEPSFS